MPAPTSATRSAISTNAGNSQPDPDSFAGLLDCLTRETSGETVTLGQLMGIVERRSFGAVILLLGFIAISPLTIVPGATWIVATVTLLFSIQLLFAQHPVLPRTLLDLKMPRDQLLAVVKATRGAAHVADRLTAPRMRWLTKPPFVLGAAIVCIVASLITFPLGLVPLAPLLPGLSVLLMGIGLTARDGVFLLLSSLAMGGSAMLLLRWLI